MRKGGSTEQAQSNIDLVDFDKDGDTFVDLA
jgi:hypothetical protein